MSLGKRKIYQDGPHTKEVLDVLSEKLNQSSLQAITKKAAQILELSVDPLAGPPKKPSDGLLYGLIQSGKTSVIQVTAAMAADNGFQCILILTSDIDLLYAQTLERMKLTLQGLSVLGKNDWQDPTRFERQLRNPPFVIVCSKNGTKLNSLMEAFRLARARGVSALIIDDEADQASLNTFTAKGGDQVSRVNEVISEFRNFFRINTYLQVTATPQALFLQNPDHKYRPSFSVLSEPGLHYVGGYEFFGDPEKKLLRFVPIDEVDILRTTHQPSPIGDVPKGLRKALMTFLVGATARKINKPTKRYAFLCHVSINKADHAHIVTLIETFKEDTLYSLKNTGSRQHQQIEQELSEAYDDLKKTEPALPPLDQIIEKLTFYLHGASVKLINCVSSDEIKLDSVYNIFIGGNKLGRGVTIENLLVSYYGRNPKKPNSDTVLQHARMYGYREHDMGITRLFLPEKLEDHFTLIHEMENALRELVCKYPEGKFEVLHISSPLQATRKNVLDPNSIVAYVSGESINPHYPLRTAQAIQYTNQLDKKLSHIPSDKDARAVVTTIDEIIELIKACPISPEYENKLWDPKIIQSALETIKTLQGNKAYIVVRRKREAMTPRRERQGILSGGEENFAPKDAPTLFMYRQEQNSKNEVAAWWPQLRFPEGIQRNYVLSFSINNAS